MSTSKALKVEDIKRAKDGLDVWDDIHRYAAKGDYNAIDPEDLERFKWYGVYRQSTRQLNYSGGGHPPALLFNGPQRQTAPLLHLASPGPLIGLLRDTTFETQTVEVAPGAQLLVFSDGVFEIDLQTGGMWSFEEFISFLSNARPSDSLIDQLYRHVQGLHGSDHLSDDFSMLAIHL